MEVIKLIKQHGDNALKELDALAIKVKQYPEENLLVLNYDQVYSPKTNPVVMECRGLILDSKTLEVVCRSFKRFFNYGEGGTEKTINLNDCDVYEKVDGSLIKIYWCNATGRWEISTRGTAFAENASPTLTSFRDGVLEAFGLDEEGFQSAARRAGLEPDISYQFEYIGPKNRIVTPYKENEMVYITCFHNESGEEFFLSQQDIEGFNLAGLRCRMVELFPLTGSEIERTVSQLGGLKEGFVVRDRTTGERCKIKSAAYVAAHNLRDNGAIRPNRVMELVLTGEHEEYLTYFQEDRPVFDVAVAQYQKALASIHELWDKAKHIEDQKEFAMAVKGSRYSPVLFAAKKHPERNPFVCFGDMPINRRADMVMGETI